MRRPKTLIILLIAVVILLTLANTIITTIHGTLGRIFMDLYQLRLSFNGAIWLIIGLVIGYFIGVIDTIKKQNKEKE